MMVSPDTFDEASTIFAAFAFLFSIGSFWKSYRLSHEFKKRDLTIELWKTWVSVDYRKLRVLASRKIKGGLEHSAPPTHTQAYQMLAVEEEDEIAIASISTHHR